MIKIRATLTENVNNFILTDMCLPETSGDVVPPV